MKNLKTVQDYMQRMNLKEYAVKKELFDLILKERGYSKVSYAKCYKEGIPLGDKRILLKND